MSEENDQSQPLYLTVFKWLVIGVTILSGLYAVGITFLASLLEVDRGVDIFTSGLIIWIPGLVLALLIAGAVAVLSSKR